MSSFQKWASKKLDEIEEMKQKGEIVKANEASASLFKTIAERHEQNGNIDQAKYMYSQAAQAYEQIQNMDMAAEMNFKASRKVLQKSSEAELKRKKSKLRLNEEIGIILSIFAFLVGTTLLVANPAGFALSQNSTLYYGGGALLILIGIVILGAIVFRYKPNHHPDFQVKEDNQPKPQVK
jgi:hypothetical protein